MFGNITKYIKTGASSNFGNTFSVLGASVILPFLPMAPIQVLTNSLLYDFLQFGVRLRHLLHDAALLSCVEEPRTLQTGWFVKSLLSQTLIIHIIRTARVPFVESRASVALIGTSLVIAAVGVALPYTALARCSASCRCRARTGLQSSQSLQHTRSSRSS